MGCNLTRLYLILKILDGKLFRSVVLACLVASLSACQGAFDGISQKANVPVPKRLVNWMKAKNMALTAPIMLRIFKQENVLEVWKKKQTGRYALLTSYEICKWSGKLGPKYKEGDRQAPEGFYRVNKHQMNPNSQYHLSFNMGFPNAYDRSHGRTGSHLMVHGACSSAGCYSMTDEKVEVIYALARDAFKGGQKSFQIQAYPFRMTAENMVKHRDHKDFPFWKMIKKGYDHFEITRIPPKVNVCEKRYEFNTNSKLNYPSSGQCPSRTMPQSLATSFVAKQKRYQTKFEKLLARAERRKPTALLPMTYAAILPGISIAGANKAVVKSTVATTKAVAPKTATPEVTTAPEVPLKAQKPAAAAVREGKLEPTG